MQPIATDVPVACVSVSLSVSLSLTWLRCAKTSAVWDKEVIPAAHCARRGSLSLDLFPR